MKLQTPAVTLALVSAVGLFAFACSSSSSPAGGTDAGMQKVDSGHPGSSTGSGTGVVTPPKKDSGMPSSGTGTGTGTGTGGTDSGATDAGTDAPAPPAIQCDPVTNAGCTDGASCDYSLDMSGNVNGFVCYAPPNTATVCQSCDPTGANAPYCGSGTTCVNTNQAETTGACAQYCCTNADCGNGTCLINQPGPDGGTVPFFGSFAPTVGICIPGTPDGGTDASVDAAIPTDGGVGIFQCTIPTTLPSGGSCVAYVPFDAGM
jgi:hypothetical protein